MLGKARHSSRAAGLHHSLAFNLKASRRPATEVLQELAEFVLPAFPSNLIINSDRPVQ